MLAQADTWRTIRSRLCDPEQGRVMAHLGPATDEEDKLVPETILALNAMYEAFDGE